MFALKVLLGSCFLVSLTAFRVETVREEQLRNSNSSETEGDVKWLPCCAVKGKCMKEDTNSKDGCPLGYHSEACDCYWRRGTPARWRCGKGNNKGLDACCCSNIAEAAVTKMDKYADDICPQPSKWYHPFKRSIDKFTGFGAKYARTKDCKLGPDTRGLFGEKKKTLGDRISDVGSAVSNVIDDYRPRIGSYDALVKNTGTGEVGYQQRGYIYNRAGVWSWAKKQERREEARRNNKRRAY